nr:hypothetical protein [Tanacetum cinerariifolium]
VNVLTSLDAATVLTSEVAKVPTGSGSIPTASPPGTVIPIGSDMIPTASTIFTTATESTPYTRRKGKEKMGMTLEEIKEKFDTVWKQFQDFIPIGSKEEPKRFKRKGLRLEQDSTKKVKTTEEVPEEKLKVKE